MSLDSYPARPAERDRWILERRAARHRLDPHRPYAFHREQERADSGAIASVTTVFLTNRECPWRCLMCDLWKNTLVESLPAGAIPAQIDFALAQLAASEKNERPLSAASGARVCDPQQREKFQAVDCSDANAFLPLLRVTDPRSGAALTAPALRHIKLYNSGSFFDSQAVPVEDHPAVAARVGSFDRIIVECHPSLIGKSALHFRDLVGQASSLSCGVRPSRAQQPNCDGAHQQSSTPSAWKVAAPGDGRTPPNTSPRLEIAIGLETAHAATLEKLNKRMTLDQFQRAASFLRENEIALRTFILVKPPFLDEGEALDWARRSIDFAFDCGATVASLIPTRPGNGALDALADFQPPRLGTLEAAAAYGISLQRGRVFADLWDLEKFSQCAACYPARRARLQEMNLRQVVLPDVTCATCPEPD